MGAEDKDTTLPERPTLPFRIANTFQLGWVGTVCRSFLLTFNRLEVNGWDGFQKLLDEREDVGARTRGLITVSNHTSVYVRIQPTICLLATETANKAQTLSDLIDLMIL